MHCFSQCNTSQINKFYSNIAMDNEWGYFSEESVSMLQKLLTDKNARKSNSGDQTGSDDDIEGNDKFKERKLE